VPNGTRRPGRRLLKALVDLVAQQGYEATTAAEIGVRAGFSGGLIHARYGTKDALLDELMRTKYEQRIVPGLGESVSGLDRLLGYVDRLGQLASEDADLEASTAARDIMVLSFGIALG
jgi:AcrR family transcriptional regulator